MPAVSSPLLLLDTDVRTAAAAHPTPYTLHPT
eukprot:CAMPEP_0181381536 /NCGR_PEP_ID=MMETSP1106-20121128/20183_1 /TAXON_ID=81844 /ORGANISM="Mantoniella antarctica, Strain SL-175" /LENGTH=31 /DNA_ID= /DNA_START= /DNA_END= /DNA_ORIENTATION=